MIPVEGHRGLYRDEKNGSIINCNDNEYEEYIKLKSLRISEKRELDSLKNEVKELKTLLFKALKEKI